MPARALHRLEGALPFLVLLGGWWLLPQLADIPAYKLPTLADVLLRLEAMVADGSLLHHVAASLWRLVLGFVVGNALAIPLGVAIGLNRHVADLTRPLLTFLQSIAGIAWIPLAVIWFGIGNGAVVFVIANIIFFSTIYNTVVGVETIPPVLYRAVRCHGGRGHQILTALVLPGALVQIIVGLRASMAFGWRALVGAELIAGTSGIGYLTIDAVQWYQTDTVVMGMLLIGVLWLVMDRLVFAPLERRTVRRWGLIQR